MPLRSKSTERRLNYANVVFAAVVVAAYLSSLSQLGSGQNWQRTALSLGLGVVYAVVGIVGLGYCERSGSLILLVAYFLFELILGAIIVLLNQLSGGFWFLLLPLASQALIALPRRLALAYMGLLAAAFVLMLGFVAGWRIALQNGLSYLAAILFVAVFTDIAIREERARAHVERLAAELTVANEKLSQYAVQAEELATAKERNRLAREIHDSLGHYLTAINIQLEAARALALSSPAADSSGVVGALEKAQSLAKESLSEVRRSVAALRISPLEGRTLRDAIGGLVDELRAAGLTADWRVLGAAHVLPASLELSIYRAAQEALTNVRKHAQAEHVDVTLDYSRSDKIALTVHDDGLGSAEPAGGFGLLGLRERMRLLGGEVQTESQVGEGFTLRVEAPL